MSRINNIEIVEELGSGGTASVLKGVDLQTGQLVAVKVLWNNLFKNESMRKRFIFEANQYLYLRHPGIVSLRDFIIKEEAYYLVMEFVDGVNLEEYINKVSGPVPEPKAIQIMAEILGAIEYAHNAGVLHLDIKPANIMLDSSGKIKILDFGISNDESKMESGTVMGSPLYMSPEQTTGKNVDKQSDIYALGITLFQLLTGTTPLRGNISRDELFEKIRNGNLPKAKEFYPFVSDALQLIIDKSTATNKNQRYSNVKDFQKDLSRIKLNLIT
jgi:serine/threonine-protein kinase